MKSLFEPHVNLAGAVMNMQLQRQNVVMSNVANLKTPGYKPMTLEFEDELQAALNLDAKGKISRTHEKHVPAAFDLNSVGAELEKSVRPHIVYGEDRVNLDKEMASMAKTSLQYSTLTTVVQKSFDGIRQIISEGAK